MQNIFKQLGYFCCFYFCIYTTHKHTIRTCTLAQRVYTHYLHMCLCDSEPWRLCCMVVVHSPGHSAVRPPECCQLNPGPLCLTLPLIQQWQHPPAKLPACRLRRPRRSPGAPPAPGHSPAPQTAAPVGGHSAGCQHPQHPAIKFPFRRHRLGPATSGSDLRVFWY